MFGIDRVLGFLIGEAEADRDLYRKSLKDPELAAEMHRRASTIHEYPIKLGFLNTVTLYIKAGHVVNSDGSMYINRWGCHPEGLSVQDLATGYAQRGDWIHARSQLDGPNL